MPVVRLCFLLLLGAFLPESLLAQIYAEEVKPLFRELKALKGTWFMPTDRGDRLEIWSLQNDSTLVGRSVRIKPENGDTVTLELLRLERRDTNITFITIARGQNKTEPVPFLLTTADYDGFTFENPDHDDPQKIRYRLLGNREIQIYTEGKRGTRIVTNEAVFEREFSPSSKEFRLRFGVNSQNLRGSGFLPKDNLGQEPTFKWKPGWEIGAAIALKGSGGFISANIELNLTGRFAFANAMFTTFEDTTLTNYLRDYTYNTTWVNLGFIPEITLKRDGKLSVIAGPYVGRLISSRGKGVLEPKEKNLLFNANNDFKKTEIGIVAGLQCKFTTGKKAIKSVIGLRSNFGMSDIDNLYTRYSDNPALSNGRISFYGATLYYCINLLNL